MEIGPRLREIRRRKEITLQEVAQETGLSKSFLSQIEAGDANPSIGSLKKIADMLTIPLAALFEIETSDRDPSAPGRNDVRDTARNDARVVRSNQRKMLVWPGQDAKISLLSPDVQRELEVTLNELHPNHDTGIDAFSHSGEECGVIIEGTLEVTVNSAVFVLEAGDSIYFASHLPHRMRVLGDKVVRTFWVSSPPTF